MNNVCLRLSVIVVVLAGFIGCNRPQPVSFQSDTPLDASDVSLDNFVDPGGMWMPQQLQSHRAVLEALGVQVADTLSDPLSYPLGAIVNFGGCSSSFVSPDGLIVTNHHCAISSLQYNSTPENNMLHDGFLARDRADERPKEAGSRIYVCLDFLDVTDQVTRGLHKITDDLQRHQAIEDRIKKIVKQNESPADGIRAMVKSYFEGDLYVLIKTLQIRDVRLVYAPPSGIGYYGGDVDNWHWPRHCGDYAFFRAYVGPDGKPADYSPDNVPYHPRHYLKIARTPLRKGDFVMVAGFPGRTSRLKTVDEARFTIETGYPYRIYLYKGLIDVLDKLAEQSDDMAIKVKRRRFGYMNSSQYMGYLLESMKQWNFLDKRIQQQQQLQSWIQQDPQRQRDFGDVLDQIQRINQDYHRTYKADTLISSLVRSVDMLGAARKITRMAAERPKPDAKRDPAYQQRNWDKMIQDQSRMQDSYDRAVDRAMLQFHFNELFKLPASQSAPIIQTITGRSHMKSDQIDSFIDSLYPQSLSIENLDQRVAWLKNASTSQLHKIDDPFIKMALRLYPLLKEKENNSKRFSGKMAVVRPRYMQALRQCANGALAPDANSTLRVTYGRVRGYRPAPDQPVYDPFTTAHQIIEKNTGVEPFDAPDAELQALRRQVWGPYQNPQYQELTIDFLSDVDTTGGNSGSATMNSKGELVGLLFDGITEGLVSDWLYVPQINRSIHTDIRYVLWLMDYVDRAYNLLDELGIQPASIPADPAQ